MKTVSEEAMTPRRPITVPTVHITAPDTEGMRAKRPAIGHGRLT